MVRAHPVKSRRPLSFGHPQHDLAASVAGVEPLVRAADLAQVQHLLHQRMYLAAFDQARQLVEARPLAREKYAEERLVLLVEGRERTVSVSQMPKPSPNAPLTSKDPSGLVTTLSLSILYTWWRSSAVRRSNSSGTIRA
jgi:hypothetical protein